MPILNITSRPDILPTWLRAMNLTSQDIKSGVRYDHTYLALPVIITGKYLHVVPEIIVSDLIREGRPLRAPRITQFQRHAVSRPCYAVDRSDNIEFFEHFAAAWFACARRQ